MNSPRGLRARQATSLGSALILTLASTSPAFAQDSSLEPSTAPASPPLASAASPLPDVDPVAGVDADSGSLTLGRWQNATLEDPPPGYFIRGVASSELGTVALGNREFDGSAIPAAWVSQDGESWQRATFPDESSGLMEAAVATPDGWVAVGRDIPDRARAWRSTDGLVWQDVTDIESAERHVLYDVASTPLGLVAVGCESELHCKVGKVWRSDDGSRWELMSQLPVQLPYSIRTVGDTLLAAGFSDGVETLRSDGVSTSSVDGITWTAPARVFKGPGGITDMSSAGNESLAVGYRLRKRPGGGQTRLYSSTDGSTWSRINDPAFNTWDGFEVASSGDLVVVAGTLPRDGDILPKTLASSDRDDWTEIAFADGNALDGYHVFDLAFTHDGSRAVLVGAAAGLPAIWHADVIVRPGEVSSRDIALGEPRHFGTASVPEGAIGVSVHDVISGGPGYVAVGGGSNTGLDLKALVWRSEDGRTWEEAKLEGDATDGVILAASAIPGGGYVGVGRDFAPANRPDDAPANALVWHSDDGSTWTSVEPHKSFKGSFLYDVTSTGDGVVAVGCRGDFHCREGRVWTSKDGLDWKLSQKVPMAPFAVAANGDMLAAGGIDDAVTLGVGRAVIVTKGESDWGITDALGKRKSQVNGAAAYGDGVVMAGWQWRANADAPKSALFVSPGGQTWDVVSPGALKGFSASDVDASGDLILVGGVRFDTALGSSTPVALWTRDLEAFERAEFPDDLSADLDLTGIAISDDGAMAFATGHEGYRPVIWYSELE